MPACCVSPRSFWYIASRTLENLSPIGGEVFDRGHREAGFFDQRGAALEIVQTGDRHALPHQFGIGGGERAVRDPVGEGEAAAGFQNTVRLGQRTRIVGDMQEGFLADDGIDACRGQRHPHHIAFDHPDFVLKTGKMRQFGGAFDAGRRQFDAGDVGAIAMRQITRWAGKAGAEIGNAAAAADAGERRQGVIGGEPAIVILIVGKQFFGRYIVEMAARRLEPGDDDPG